MIETKGALKPMAHYSQAIRAGEFLFVSGQTPRHPETGEIPEDFRGQVVQVLESLRAIVDAAGTSMDYVTKITVFLKNDDDDEFDEMNDVFREFFCNAPPPTRTTVQAGIGKIGIEIDAIAWIPPESE
ncbi:MAG: RidA family protein [Anaerolineales bacterium]|nr:RidA family protein [Anaerolineales bacterium]